MKKKSIAGLSSALLLLVSGFLFPLFRFSVFGRELSEGELTIVNIMIDFLQGKYQISESYEILTGLMILSFLISLSLYALNGIGLIRKKYSVYSSYLTLLYLIFGLVGITLINRSGDYSIFGLGKVEIGLGVYFVPLVGLCYLIFGKYVDKLNHRTETSVVQ